MSKYKEVKFEVTIKQVTGEKQNIAAARLQSIILTGIDNRPSITWQTKVTEKK